MADHAFDTGYGEPTDPGTVGFGSPDSGGPEGFDLGFGHPDADLAGTVAILSATTLTDDGGQIVTLSGNFDAPPYSVRMVAPDGTAFPLAPLYCWSGQPGYGPDCYPIANQQNLRFVVPPLMEAVYTVRVYAAGGVSTDAIGSITIVRRTYFQSTYRQRTSFPRPWLGPGARRVAEEPWPEGV